jgi:hypothetical protein
MIKVRAHTCYLGNTGYASHARNFFRAFSKYVDLRVRNYTWDPDPKYLDDVDFAILDMCTLLTDNKVEKDFHISHAFPNLPFCRNCADSVRAFCLLFLFLFIINLNIKHIFQ